MNMAKNNVALNNPPSRLVRAATNESYQLLESRLLVDIKGGV